MRLTCLNAARHCLPTRNACSSLRDGKVFPAMVNVPVRGAASLFGDTEKLAVPLPVPLPELITIQSSLLILDQVHLLSGVVSETLPVPPVDGMDHWWLV